jgi:hypothetical protein
VRDNSTLDLYHYDETSGSIAHDDSATPNDATLVGPATLQPACE